MTSDIDRRARDLGRILVYCNSPRHPKKVATLGAFWPSSFREQYSYPVEASWHALGSHIETVTVDGRAVHDRTDVLGGADKTDAHRRYRVTCPLCRRPLLTRAEGLWPLLDTLAEHGVGSISIDALSARLQ